jgi:hypothetical protein
VIEQGDYGPALVTAGVHRWRVGYYDDDEGAYAIVYFGVPFLSWYELVARSALVATDAVPIGAAALCRRTSLVARALDVVERRRELTARPPTNQPAVEPPGRRGPRHPARSASAPVRKPPLG